MWHRGHIIDTKVRREAINLFMLQNCHFSFHVTGNKECETLFSPDYLFCLLVSMTNYPSIFRKTILQLKPKLFIDVDNLF